MNTPHATTPLPSSPAKSPLPGLKELLLGASGTGKTHSLRTLVDCGLTPFIIFTEPGQDILGDIPCEKLHWAYVKPASVPWKVLQEQAKIIKELSFKAIKSWSDPNRNAYDQFLQVAGLCNDFVCDRCGKHFGDTQKWNTDRVLCWDGLSGISRMAYKLAVGGKPSPDQGEWGVAMSQIEDVVEAACNSLTCHFVLIAHLERESGDDEQSKFMPSTLGKKLSPKLSRSFSDVIQTIRIGTKFSWSTLEPDVDAKARNLPWGKDLPPTFKTPIDTWTRRGGLILPTTST